MRINRRDEKLDGFIGEMVHVVFVDGTEACGVLGFQERLQGGENTDWIRVKPQFYFLKYPNGTHLSFRKAHVKSIQRRESDE